MTKTTIISSPAEFGAGTRGASLGFSSMMILAEDSRHCELNDVRIIDLYTPEYKYKAPSGSFFGKNIEKVESTLQNLSDAVKSALGEKESTNPLIVFTGDHSNAAGTIRGIKTANPSKKLGIIWIDAHADLHTPLTSPSGNMHGMPLGMLLKHNTEIDNKRELNTDEKKIWSKLEQPSINPDEIVFIALRDTEWQEDKIISDNNIKVIRTPEVDVLGEIEVVKQSVEHLAGCDIIYVSFDIDSLDSSHVPGTGTPVNNGLNLSQAEKLLTNLVKHEKVMTLEFTELNPMLDTHDSKTVKNVLGLFCTVINS